MVAFISFAPESRQRSCKQLWKVALSFLPKVSRKCFGLIVAIVLPDEALDIAFTMSLVRTPQVAPRFVDEDSRQMYNWVPDWHLNGDEAGGNCGIVGVPVNRSC